MNMYDTFCNFKQKTHALQFVTIRTYLTNKLISDNKIIKVIFKIIIYTDKLNLFFTFATISEINHDKSSICINSVYYFLNNVQQRMHIKLFYLCKNVTFLFYTSNIPFFFN